ncbi:hypothetical protein DHEL01_v210049 [Diaporthe helianthi]|uniref:Uncharacterized protein n=1 Tax=Diaporthe helianthi TaxID=158607 RepID=A0A2P5HMV8_DIAHE|nr:hypothetical protein DHEL01_v210049 [Diaporthe helianthi]
MFERMSTTGEWQSLQPFPSRGMLPDSDLADMNRRAGHNAAPYARMRGVANFGCVDDRIEHVLFRVIGDKHIALAGLVNQLYPSGPDGSATRQPGPKLWVIHAGTKNLHPTEGLGSEALLAMEILLQTLFSLTSPGTRFLLSGLFYRKDIPSELVDLANKQFQELVVKLQNGSPEPSPSPDEQQSYRGKGKGPAHQKSDSGVSGLAPSAVPPPRTFEFLAPELDSHATCVSLLDGHVHLNREGYRMWMRKLLPKMEQMLSFSPLQPQSPQEEIGIKTWPSPGDKSTVEKKEEKQQN